MFPHPGRAFSATKTKVAENCLKWIDLKPKISLILAGGGLFCHRNQSCWKLHEMDRSNVKKVSLIPHPGGEGGGAFLPQNQSCSKLPEMDKSEVKKFSLILGQGDYLPQKPKNQSCSKLPEMDRSEVKKISLILGWGLFCPIFRNHYFDPGIIPWGPTLFQMY